MRCAGEPEAAGVSYIQDSKHFVSVYIAQLLINITNSFITLRYVDLVTLHNEYLVLSQL